MTRKTKNLWKPSKSVICFLILCKPLAAAGESHPSSGPGWGTAGAPKPDPASRYYSSSPSSCAHYHTCQDGARGWALSIHWALQACHRSMEMARLPVDSLSATPPLSSQPSTFQLWTYFSAWIWRELFCSMVAQAGLLPLLCLLQFIGPWCQSLLNSRGKKNRWG